MRRYGNRLQFVSYRERPVVSFVLALRPPRFFPFSSMPRPRALELPAPG
jgi:hypothetical protein